MRAFARAPGLTCALLLTIALGIGSNATTYGFLQGLTHPGHPLKSAAGTVSISRQDRSRSSGPLSPAEFQKLKQSDGVFEWIGAVRIKPVEVEIDGRPEIVTLAAVTPELAKALVIPLDSGVVISHRIWKNDFGGANALGAHVRISSSYLRINGVAPEQLDGVYHDQSIDLWTQADAQEAQGAGGDRRDLWVLAKLRGSVSVRQAQAALRARADNLGELSVAPFTGVAPNMTRGLARVGMFLNFSAGVVFFIACVDVASLLLGRALRRSHETSLRIALGANRGQLLFDLFADSAVISISGGAMGLLLGILTARSIPALLVEEDAERLSFAPHLVPILASSMVCILILVICGMLPVLGTVTDRPWMVLQRETGSPSKAILRLRSVLVVAQITACCMLVVSTALLREGLHAALETSEGRRLGDPVLLTVAAPVRPDGPAVDVHYFSEVAKMAKSVPGLLPIAWTAWLPGSQPTWRSFGVQRISVPYREVAMDIAWLTPDSLRLFDSQPIAGRMFGFNDQSERVAVVNEEAAAELFGPRSVGVVIRDPADLPVEIIGVIRRKPAAGMQQRRPTIYYGYLDQSEAPSPTREVRFRVPLEPPLRDVVLNTNSVSSNYFAALDLPLVAGQKFHDDRMPGQGRVAVINQEASDLYFNGSGLGADVIDENGVRTEVIGVVRSQIFGTFEQHAEPTIYFPMWQDCPLRMTLILKDSAWNSAIASELRSKIQGLPGRSQFPLAINTFDAQLAQSGLAALRIALLIGSLSAATALLLSILGLLSAQGDAERQRQSDRALRIALGAQRWNIVLMVVKSAAGLALGGTVIGTFLSWVFLRLAVADTGVVHAPPFEVWLVAPLLPAAAVMLASIVPARRAAVVSPLAIMRDR